MPDKARFGVEIASFLAMTYYRYSSFERPIVIARLREAISFITGKCIFLIFAFSKTYGKDN